MGNNKLLDQIIYELEETGADREAALLQQCEIQEIYVDELFELQGERCWSAFDVDIHYPKDIERDPNVKWADFTNAVEEAFRQNAQVNGAYARNFMWVPTTEKIKSSPVMKTVDLLIENIDSLQIHRAWQRALRRKNVDPEGAVTSARALLEATCKKIIADHGVHIEKDLTLPQMYRIVSDLLKLGPAPETSDLIRRILGNCQSIVTSLGALRNQVGDAHGQAPDYSPISTFHAELAVNLAGSMALFLLSCANGQRERHNMPNG